MLSVGVARPVGFDGSFFLVMIDLSNDSIFPGGASCVADTVQDMSGPSPLGCVCSMCLCARYADVRIDGGSHGMATPATADELRGPPTTWR